MAHPNTHNLITDDRREEKATMFPVSAPHAHGSQKVMNGPQSSRSVSGCTLSLPGCSRPFLRCAPLPGKGRDTGGRREPGGLPESHS